MAGFTSGGEQQMTAVGRALMARPSLILLDEPSMGLAPQVVEEILGIVRSLNRGEGVSFLLAEQNAAAALRFADLAGNADVKEFYLGLGGAGRMNFRDAKHYRRRKRWLA